MKAKAIVIINEQHSLFPDQERLLAGMDVELLFVPANGWNKQEMKDKLNELSNLFKKGKGDEAVVNIIFASPIPVLVLWLASLRAIKWHDTRTRVFVFHNDKLSNGKIINTVSAEGWELVEWEGLSS